MINTQELARYMSSEENWNYVTSSPNDEIKRQRIDELKARFLSGNFAAVNFAANPYVEDGGNPAADESGIYDDCSTFAEYSTKAREVTAFGRIKSLIANNNMRESLKTFILSRNSQIRTANKIAEAKKEKKKSNVSRPFWY